MPVAVHGPEVWIEPVFQGGTALTTLKRAAALEEEAGVRRSTCTYKEDEKDNSEEGKCCQKAITIEFVAVYVAMSLPLIYVMPEM